MSVVLALALAAGARDTIGVFGGWGAFRDAEPARCYAIAQPVDPSHRAGFASIATWPGRNVRGQLHVRLSRALGAAPRVTLSIGERRFDLTASGSDAWAPDARTDAAISAAMREGRSMSVEGVDRAGAPFADSYALAGAATAIDAAALACRR
ncbi:MAG: hypothetical protein J0I47_13220 [Sphingomonas sp.]|uniref:hypothetical protein n=1 Tax=Sphingomonas sp. TaxID=28214 RepID=UPI001AD32108|nr:hypothetical protein [Sphingomonas sp.]MBN8809179.1 hypothetical protein [Sphingomonas sp.]